jgi:hypothetical protein
LSSLSLLGTDGSELDTEELRGMADFDSEMADFDSEFLFVAMVVRPAVHPDAAASSAGSAHKLFVNLQVSSTHEIVSYSMTTCTTLLSVYHEAA